MHSVVRASDPYGDDAARDVVGLSFRAAQPSESLHSNCAFGIRTEERNTRQSELRLPDIIVYGIGVLTPKVHFQCGRHTKLKGFIGV